MIAKFLSPFVQQKEHIRDKSPGERRESLVIVVRVMVVVCVNRRHRRRLAEHQLSVYLISTKRVYLAWHEPSTDFTVKFSVALIIVH